MEIFIQLLKIIWKKNQKHAPKIGIIETRIKIIQINFAKVRIINKKSLIKKHEWINLKDLINYRNAAWNMSLNNMKSVL